MPTIQDFTDISDKRQTSVAHSPDYEFGWKQKLGQIKKLDFNTNINSIYSNMDAHELMLRHSQYICFPVLVNKRFSIMKKKNPEERRCSRLGNIFKIWSDQYSFLRCTFQTETILSKYQDKSRTYFI